MRLSPVVALTVALLCGCSSSVVSGRGVNSSTSGFPSSSSSSTSPSSPPATQTTPASGGALITNTAGHYQVRMAGPATRKSQPGSFAGVTFTVYTDVVQSPYVEVMGSEDISVELPSSQYEVTLKQAVMSFETSSSTTEVSAMDTTFRGRQARRADVTRNGDPYTFMAVIWAPNRLYLMFAPAGAPFDALTNSFVPLP